jgi:hypothetical protein
LEKIVSNPIRRNGATYPKKSVFNERNGHFVRSRPNRGTTTRLKPLAKSFAVTLAFSLATYVVVMSLIDAYQQDWKIFLYLAGFTAIAWLHFSQLNTRHGVSWFSVKWNFCVEALAS